MNWLISLEQFEELATSRPSPPYFLLLAGLLIILACAIPLTIAIRQRIEYWSKRISPNAFPAEARLQTILPFSGTVSGFCIFLTAGLEVLGLPVLPSLVVALLVSGSVAYLAWFMLGRMFNRRALRSYLEQFSDVNFR